MTAAALEALTADLVLANRILAQQQVVDAFGHVSARHPARPEVFLLSRSLSPAQVVAADICEYDLEGRPLRPVAASYLERFIHGSAYRARPDIGAVIHCHALPLVAFGLAGAELRPATHVSAAMGARAPVWDIRDRFGATNLLVTSPEQGDDLAQTLGGGAAVLMRGHGATFVAPDVRSAVLTALYAVRNAEAVLEASRLGPVTFLHPDEVEPAREALLGEAPRRRAWDYYAVLAMQGGRALSTYDGRRDPL